MTPGPLNLTLWRGSTFGPVTFTCKDSQGNAVDLTGWVPLAQVRVAPIKPVMVDLAPTIPNPVNGKVVIYFTDEQTLTMPHGDFVWDFLLQNPSGEILGPFLAGKFTIRTNVTQP